MVHSPQSSHMPAQITVISSERKQGEWDKLPRAARHSPTQVEIVFLRSKSPWQAGNRRERWGRNKAVNE